MNHAQRRKAKLNHHFKIKKSRPHGMGNHVARGRKKNEKRLAAKRTRKISRMRNKPLVK